VLYDDEYIPGSFRDVAEVTLLLRTCLGVSRCVPRRKTRGPKDVVQRILDSAGYWARTTAFVDILASQQPQSRPEPVASPEWSTNSQNPALSGRQIALCKPSTTYPGDGFHSFKPCIRGLSE
jgi:hypothetical protein